MTTHELTVHAESLEAKIANASPTGRLSLQPQLQKILIHLEADGVAVPRRLQKLNAELIDEVIEARFDNVPV
ncbi:hypothetical protein [Aestuariivita sp.]|jgi:hypothetical protein|uniref:hypothetical protein n=1 Tax=Aestuariivita sp. TaxID=1872407 RepID=UPI00216BBBF3|nr:hypothetical protein [Aestuariivita sp.]MCE8007859.1 hypothetical protein [Aestuariivita sp.]